MAKDSEVRPEATMRLFPLSGGTSLKIAWEKFLPELQLAHESLGATLGVPPTESGREDPKVEAGTIGQGPKDTKDEAEVLPSTDKIFERALKKVNQAFLLLDQSFSEQLRPLQKRNQVVSWCLYVAFGTAFIGAILAAIHPIGGVAFSLANTGALFALLRSAVQLDRDSAMLALVPARYRLAISLCTSREQLAKILEMMLKETEVIKGNP